jgi:hypothetical protein
MDAMTFFVFVAAGAAAVSLCNGVVSMAHGGESDLRHSHELMFQRTAWQGLAVLFIMLALPGGL